MATLSLFNDDNSESESDTEFKISEEYAEKYDQWRGKEVLQKLKDRYGSDLDSASNTESSSSSSEEEEITSPDNEKSFLKLLSLLKSGNPQIIDRAAKISNADIESSKNIHIKKSDKPMFLRDYERKVLLEDSSIVNGEKHEETTKEHIIGYYEQQEQLRESLKVVEGKDDDDEDLLMVKSKTKQEQEVEEEEYKLWLKGLKSSIKDEDAKDFKYLRDYWAKSNLSEDEKFLKDFFLNQPYLNDEAEDEMEDREMDNEESKAEDLEEDEVTVEQQQNFERKYNFRFQEPDAEFIKTYPRVIKSSLRTTDDRRKLKRAEIKERKMKEKERKKEELKQMKSLKKMEIMRKLKQIQEITGNATLPFEEEDIDGDFDSEKHEEKMKQMFNDDYYKQLEGDKKPEFPDEEDDVNWDKWVPEEDNIGPECEDPSFNMDADQIQESIPDKKKWRLNEILKQKKPVFDPTIKSYQEYLDEYYKLDYEDIIDDIPCRFKYREVIPNDFGLSIEEIFCADDRELNSWCSLKKCVQLRSREQELQDVNNFKNKAQNITKKMHILSSLTTANSDTAVPTKRRKCKKKNLSEDQDWKNRKKSESLNENQDGLVVKQQNELTDNVTKEERIHSNQINKSKSVKPRSEQVPSIESGATKYIERLEEKTEKNFMSDNPHKINRRARRKRNRKHNQFSETSKLELNKSTHFSNRPTNRNLSKNNVNESPDESSVIFTVKRKKCKPIHSKFSSQTTSTTLSDERLKAYGFNPKKFRNKEKYKPKMKTESTT